MMDLCQTGSMKRLLLVPLFSVALLAQAQTQKPDKHGVIYSNPSNPHLTKTQSELQAEQQQAPQEPNQQPVIYHESKPLPEQQKHRRFAFGPQIGAAFLGYVKGYDMKPAFSLGLRSSYDVVSTFLAIGLNVNVNFVHFSEEKEDTHEVIDMSSLSYMLFVDIKPFHGMHFGPYFGVSNKAYAFRKEGFLSHRDKKGTDNFVAAGGFFGWDFKLGKRFHLGPRVDVVNYAPFGRSYMSAHTGFDIVCATKWTF